MRQLLTSLLFFVVVFVCQANKIQAQDEPPYQFNERKAVSLPSGLKYVIIEEGEGIKPEKGDQIVVHYYGHLKDDKVFDSSFERGTPFTIEIGVGKVIKGWDEGLLLLNEGTKAVLICPPNLAYGNLKTATIPASSTLYFHIELIKVKPKKRK